MISSAESMPAPRPSITAMTVANAGRPRGAERRERAEQEREQDDRDADADQLADRRLLLGGEVDEDAAGGHLHAAALRGLGRGEQLLAVGLLEVLRLQRVADVDGGQAAVARDRSAACE